MREKSTDAELVSDYLAGDDAAFTVLYGRYERQLFSYIYRFAGERRKAEDLFQQTWLKMINGLSGYEERRKFSSWLFGIAHNCCIDELRRASRKNEDCSPMDDAAGFRENRPDPEETLLFRERADLLNQALQRLPEEQKTVVLLRLKADLPFKEIAEITNCSLNTVLGRMHYAVRNLRKHIVENSGEEPIHVLS